MNKRPFLGVAYYPEHWERRQIDEDLDKMQKVLENLSFSVNSENEVLGIILEEAGAYFAGQKSAAEVSDIIQSRISVYLKENE
jgi:hypothetical protein